MSDQKHVIIDIGTIIQQQLQLIQTVLNIQHGQQVRVNMQRTVDLLEKNEDGIQDRIKEIIASLVEE